MDDINILPDDLLMKILTYVPTKLAVSTSIMSKRWEFLWMWSPKLDYTSQPVTNEPGLFDFIDKKLPLHKAHIIESFGLYLNCSENIRPEDIKRWIETAVSRHVRELNISFYLKKEDILPSSFFSCKSLVILKLKFVTLINVPSMVCLPSLKTMQLEYVTFGNGETLQQFLSICPVLEDLLMDCELHHENMKELAIIVPSLLSLSLFIPEYWWNLDGYVIDTPSLKYLKLDDWNSSNHYSKLKNMPKLKGADVDVKDFLLESVIGSITSLNRLTLCSEDVYGDGCTLNQLEHLTLCLCKKNSSNLLSQLLKDSPNLRVLDVSILEYHGYGDEHNGMVCWNEPSSVPKCLLSSLQIFKWSRYFGRPQDRDIAVYILRNACHLKTATFLADTTEHSIPNLQMIKELTLSSRASTTCELVFVEG